MTKSSQVSGLSVCIDMITRGLGDSSTKVTIDNARHIELSILRFKPKNVILTSIFLTSSELSPLVKKFPSVKFFVMVHSNLPFLAVEGEGMQRIKEAIELGVTVVSVDERMSRSVQSIWLPNIYKKNFFEPKKVSNNEVLKIVCAGSMRHMKNHLTQAIASIKYAEKFNQTLEFYCNTSRSEGGSTVLMNLKSLFKNSKHKIKSLPWLNHTPFIESLREFDIGLQVSISETFNIVSADYTCAGLPMVVSHEVDWASEGVKANCHDVDLIVEKMIGCDNFVFENQTRLNEYSEKAIEKWKNI